MAKKVNKGMIKEALKKSKRARLNESAMKSRFKKLSNINENEEVLSEEDEKMMEQLVAAMNSGGPSPFSGGTNEEIKAGGYCLKNVEIGKDRGTATACLRGCPGCGGCECYDVEKTKSPGGDADMRESIDQLKMQNTSDNAESAWKTFAGCKKSDVLDALMENITAGGTCIKNVQSEGGRNLSFDVCGGCPCGGDCKCASKRSSGKVRGGGGPVDDPDMEDERR